MISLAQYFTTTTTADWTVRAFGGRWGLSEFRLDPGAQFYTEVWCWTEVAEFHLPAATVAFWIGVALATATGAALVVLDRKRKTGRRPDDGATGVIEHPLELP